ncbi:hypothetical protein I79_003537 [Cricetulus griseus]|uniref:Uncharacterized protein n=1 Tax=Cricetulus griseus TaxID=10029 RepID=G3H0A0_CRIGR|nr:hypothetical protein I79_003537 [Cricetulus griseus]
MFSSPQEHYAGRNHGFALFTRRGDLRGQQKLRGLVKTVDEDKQAFCWTFR